MAYALPLDTECTEEGCTRTATYEVRNGRNEVVRRCCQPHAEALVRRISADEDAARHA